MKNSRFAVISMLCILFFPLLALADLDCGDEVYQKLRGRDLASLADREYDYIMRYKSACESIEKANRVGKGILSFGVVALIVLAPLAIIGFLVDHYRFSRFGERFKQGMFALGAITTFLFILAIFVVLGGLLYPLVLEHLRWLTAR